MTSLTRLQISSPVEWVAISPPKPSHFPSLVPVSPGIKGMQKHLKAPFLQPRFLDMTFQSYERVC